MPSSASTGHEDPQRPADRGRRHDTGGEGGVPAARRRRVSGARQRGESERPGHLEMQGHAHQMARLVRAGDVAGLVLHPHAPRPANPRAPERTSLRRSGVAAKPWPSTRATAEVRLRDQGDELAASAIPPAMARW